MVARTVVVALAVLTLTTGVAGEPQGPSGVIAVSAGTQVHLVDPSAAAVKRFASGPVGFLYPAPGGRLFAPDLVGGRTLELDLRSARVIGQLDGVTLPRFGSQDDRYLVVARGDVLVFSYPERAPLLRIEAGIESPWQVVHTADDTMVFVLDRRPDGEGDPRLLVVDLVGRTVSQRAILPGDVVRIALSTPLGLLALADRSGRSVQLIQPATLERLAEVAVAGHPVDTAFTADGHLLVTASDDGATGRVAAVQLKQTSKGLKLKPRFEAALPSTPSRLALDPSGAFAVVVLESGLLRILDLEHGETVGEADLGAPPRDVVWCDPTREGPLLPEWSDRAPTPVTRDLRRPAGG